MKIDGRCHCGYITYEAEIDPDKTLVCHCTDCQTMSGAPFRAVAYTREDAFTLLSGELKVYVKVSESGNKRPQSFCPECGTPIHATAGAKDPRSTPFDWAQFVNATRSFRRRMYGFAPRSHGSLTLDRCERSKSSRRSIRLARYISLSVRQTRPMSAVGPSRHLATRSKSVASLIGHSGSSAFRPSASTIVSMSLTVSCFSSESAPRPFHHGS